jgi:hypothetical protein
VLSANFKYQDTNSHLIILILIDFFLCLLDDEYSQIIMLPGGGNEKESQNYGYSSQFVIKQGSSKTTTSIPRAVKRESAPLQTSYTVPFHFVESGRRNQLLICDGQKYILNNKYGEKSCKLMNCGLFEPCTDEFLPLFSPKISNALRGTRDAKHEPSRLRLSPNV